MWQILGDEFATYPAVEKNSIKKLAQNKWFLGELNFGVMLLLAKNCEMEKDIPIESVAVTNYYPHPWSNEAWASNRAPPPPMTILWTLNWTPPPSFFTGPPSPPAGSTVMFWMPWIPHFELHCRPPAVFLTSIFYNSSLLLPSCTTKSLRNFNPHCLSSSKEVGKTCKNILCRNFLNWIK